LIIDKSKGGDSFEFVLMTSGKGGYDFGSSEFLVRGSEKKEELSSKF
jgi:hypothetical protein